MPNVGIITPVKNEEENLRELYQSILNQSIEIDAWVLIDDNSSDNSAQLITEFASSKEWISGYSMSSGRSDYNITGVGKVLNYGYERLREMDSLDYYMVMDGDMKITDSYVEELLQYMEEHNNCAISSGAIYVEKNSGYKKEKRADDQPAGGATVFRGTFLEEIGGIPTYPKWDSIAKAKAKILGYDCRHLSNLDGKAIQTRETGSKGSAFMNNISRGKNEYRLNYYPPVTVLKSGYKIATFSVAEGFGLFFGYAIGFLNRIDRVDDEDVKQYYYHSKKQKLRRKIRSAVDPRKWRREGNT